MKDNGSIKGILLLDREAKDGNHRSIQKSIEKIVEHENYAWQTLRVQEDTKIKVESLLLRRFFDRVGQIPVGDSNIEKVLG